MACLPSDFKKKGGYLRSIELSRQYDLYRQDYCGCVFSKRERDKRIVQESCNRYTKKQSTKHGLSKRKTIRNGR